MIDDKVLKEVGVKKLSQSKSGREYMEKLRGRHKNDLLQPTDKKFDKVYGKKLRFDQKIQDRQEKESQDMWGESKERKIDEEKRKVDPGYKRVY